MKRKFLISAIILAIFILWTALVDTVNVAPVGPMGSSVGMSWINGQFHRITGVHMGLYTITDKLSFIPMAIAVFFAAAGLLQWIRRKKLRLVDHDILALGIFYAAVMAAFLFFEIFVINYRPILIDGMLEASYPSSTTMLVMCVLPTAMMQAHWRIQNQLIRQTLKILMGLFMIFMVIARLISGVHWLTDIIGGALLSAGLVLLYNAVCSITKTPL